MVINPRTRRRRARRARVTTRHRARRRRRNPFLPYAMNPRRHRRGVMRRHRRRVHNPALFGRGTVFGIPLMGAFNVAIGAVGSDILAGLAAKWVPQVAGMGKPGKLLVKAGVVAGGSMLMRRFVGRQMANAFALGGGVSLLLDVYNEYVKPMLPAGLADYETETLPMGSYESEFSLGALTAEAQPEMYRPVYG